MSKSSKECGYTGHMHVMDRVNSTKAMHESNQAKALEKHQQAPQAHSKHKMDYPEVQQQTQSLHRCICKK